MSEAILLYTELMLSHPQYKYKQQHYEALHVPPIPGDEERWHHSHRGVLQPSPLCVRLLQRRGQGVGYGEEDGR